MNLKITVPETVPFDEVETLIRREGISIFAKSAKRRYLHVEAELHDFIGGRWEIWKEQGLTIRRESRSPYAA